MASVTARQHDTQSEARSQAGHWEAARKGLHLSPELLHVRPLRALRRQVRRELLELAGGGRLRLAVLRNLHRAVDEVGHLQQGGNTSGGGEDRW
jgi:hypothetical protein